MDPASTQAALDAQLGAATAQMPYLPHPTALAPRRIHGLPHRRRGQPPRLLPAQPEALAPRPGDGVPMEDPPQPILRLTIRGWTLLSLPKDDVVRWCRKVMWAYVWVYFVSLAFIGECF